MSQYIEPRFLDSTTKMKVILRRLRFLHLGYTVINYNMMKSAIKWKHTEFRINRLFDFLGAKTSLAFGDQKTL